MTSFYHISQPDAMDCGPACLCMIAGHYGKRYTLDGLRQNSFIGKDGVSLLGISRAAEKMGLRTIGGRLTLDTLTEKAMLPYIVHWKRNHFVVVYGIKNSRRGKTTVLVADPGKGLLKYSKEEFCANWISTVTSNEAAKKYLNDQLRSLAYYFDRYFDFHQYYRSGSTVYDKYYFVRGKVDPKLCTDSSRFNSDLKFSTVYDFNVAKIIANEMLRIYLNRRLKMIEDPTLFVETKKSRRTWTGQKNALIELGYSLHASGDIDHGNIDVKEVMDTLGEAFNVDLGEYYRTYIALRERKKDRTAYLNSLIEKLTKKMATKRV